MEQVPTGPNSRFYLRRVAPLINKSKNLIKYCSDPEEKEARDYSEELGIGGKDNIKVDFRETGCEGVDWIHMAQDRDKWRDLVNTVVNLRAQ
jgi:hypothetical protein